MAEKELKDYTFFQKVGAVVVWTIITIVFFIWLFSDGEKDIEIKSYTIEEFKPVLIENFDGYTNFIQTQINNAVAAELIEDYSIGSASLKITEVLKFAHESNNFTDRDWLFNVMTKTYDSYGNEQKLFAMRLLFEQSLFDKMNWESDFLEVNILNNLTLNIVGIGEAGMLNSHCMRDAQTNSAFCRKARAYFANQ